MGWTEFRSKGKRAWGRLQGKPRFQQVQQLLERYSDCQLADAAAAMTYYFSLSLFPFAIFLAEVLARVGKNLALAGSLKDLQSLIPQPVQDFLVPMVSEITAQVHLSLLSLSALSILWASSRGFDSFLQYMDSIYHNEEKPFLLKKALGLIFTLLLTLLFALLLIAVSFGSLLLGKLAEWTKLPFFQDELLYWGRLLLPFICIELILSGVYYLLSHRKRPFRYAVYGAILPTISWLALSLGLSWYISSFTKYDVIYGSISGLILFLLWLYLLMQTMFIGAFLHEEGLRVYRNRGRKSAEEPALEAEAEAGKLEDGLETPSGMHAEETQHKPASESEDRRRREVRIEREQDRERIRARSVRSRRSSRRRRVRTRRWGD